jgi:hypothetical protein
VVLAIFEGHSKWLQSHRKIFKRWFLGVGVHENSVDWLIFDAADALAQNIAIELVIENLLAASLNLITRDQQSADEFFKGEMGITPRDAIGYITRTLSAQLLQNEIDRINRVNPRSFT